MTQRSAPPEFPQALDSDDDDVAWALQTALVQWSRQAHVDALVWLRRAIDAARERGRIQRAEFLEQRSRSLQLALSGMTTEQELSSIDLLPETFEDGTDVIEIDPFAESDTAPPPDTDEELTEDELLRAASPSDDLEEFDDVEILALSSGYPSAAAAGAQPTIPTEPESTALSAAEGDPLESTGEATERDLEPGPFSSRGSRRARSEPSLVPHSEPERTALSATNAHLVSELPPSDGDVRVVTDSPPTIVETIPPERESDPPSESGLRMLPDQEVEAERLLYDPPTLTQSTFTPEASTRVPASAGAPASSEPAPPTTPEPASNAGAPAQVGGVLLSTVLGLEDLPEDVQAQMASSARIHALNPDEEIEGFGLALVLEGSVAVMPTVADVAAARARRGDPVFSQGHLEDGIRVRVVAGEHGAQVASWSPAELESAVRDCPWVGDELRNVGDRFQALAGITMGAMGEYLDDMLRGLVLARCEIKRLLPGEVVAEPGKPLKGLFLVGAGRLEILSEADVVTEELGPGDFLFPSQILQASPAPARARAGKGGALVLFADRPVAHELMVSVPPLLELFAR